MKGRIDVVGAAETGSGKTLAFGIPILHGILKDKEFEQKRANNPDNMSEDDEPRENDPQQEGVICDEINHVQEGVLDEENNHMSEEDINEGMSNGFGCVKVIEDVGIVLNSVDVSSTNKKLRALIITPTRELAVQIEKHLKAVAKYTDITMALVIGGMAAPKQERLLNKGPDIVIGTPGRLWELIEGGNPHLSQVNNIRLVLAMNSITSVGNSFHASTSFNSGTSP